MLELILGVIGILLGLIGIAVTLRLANRNVLPLTADAVRLRVFSIRRRGSRLRVSSSALVDIHEGGRWILVGLPEDRPGEFGPLGGAFKFQEEAKRVLAEVEFVGDTGLPLRSVFWLNDLRGFLPTRNFHDFLAWWRSGEGRESGEECLRREVREELVSVGRGQLSEEFDGLKLVQVRSILEGPKWVLTGEGGFWQVRLFEVYIPRPESRASEAFVGRLMAEAEQGKGLVAVTAAEIRRGRISEGTISGHSAYLLGRRRDRFEPAGRTA